MKRFAAQGLKWVAVCLFVGMLVVLAELEAQAQEASTAISPVSHIWLTPGASETLDRATMRVRSVAGQTADTSVKLFCTCTSEYAVDDPMLTCQIKDASGTVLFEKSEILFVDKTERSATFVWDLKAVPDGLFTARFSLERRPKFLMVWNEYILHKTSAEGVRHAQSTTQQALESLREKTQAVPLFNLRWTLAQDALKRSGTLLDCGDVSQSDSFVSYAADAAKRLQAETASESLPAELGESVPPVSFPITMHEGVFYSAGRPVFLMGLNYGAVPNVSELDRIKALGLNLAAFSITPADSLASDQGIKDLAGYDGVFSKASSDGVNLLVSLDPLAMPHWMLEKYPALRDNGLGETDIFQPKSREQTKRHFQAVARYVADKPALLALSLMDNARFKFTGTETRTAFQTWIKGRYPDLQGLCRAWRTNFDSFAEADIAWTDKQTRYLDAPAYRYDWQTFQQAQGVSYSMILSEVIKENAPHATRMLAPSGSAFEPGESAFGVDREALASAFDLNGCCVPLSFFDAHYAVHYPAQSAVYTLLRSFAPDKPVVNLQDAVSNEAAAVFPCLVAPMRASMWEAVLSGLNASTLYGNVGELDPQLLEGYATACFELNRLAPLVAAFQQAPAEIGILWSMPSKILNEGTANLASVKSAYEGSSFLGYKVRFVSEQQIQHGALKSISVLIIPETPALADATFPVLRDYVQSGANVVTTPAQIAYDERGQSRRDVINSDRRTFLVRGENLPTEYLHALDAVASQGGLPEISRIVNASGYPIEGVKSRCITIDGVQYLYVLNLRKTSVSAQLHGPVQHGRDLIRGRDITFPMALESLDPMLIRLDKIQ